MKTILHTTPAYRLTAELTPTAHGHHLRLVSLVPTARRPEEQVRFETLLGQPELRALRQLIDDALRDDVSTDEGATEGEMAPPHTGG